MLEIREIYKTFNAGTINETRAINGASLTPNDGECVTVIGGTAAAQCTPLALVGRGGAGGGARRCRPTFCSTALR